MSDKRAKGEGDGQRANVEIVTPSDEQPYGDFSYEAIKRRHNEVKPSKEGFLERANRILKEADDAK